MFSPRMRRALPSCLVHVCSFIYEKSRHFQVTIFSGPMQGAFANAVQKRGHERQDSTLNVFHITQTHRICFLRSHSLLRPQAILQFADDQWKLHNAEMGSPI
jgi:hypothetical protein